jgi:N-acetylmuramoyl-L-alanine amidase
MNESIPPSPRVIAIDPGHGGNDPGKENSRLHLQEKACTLDVALRLKRLLDAAGYRVVMTRESDRYVDLPVRAAIANVAKADLFVSIHFNAGAATDTHTHGTEVFTFPLAYQRSDQSWNDHRNDAETAPSPVNRFDGWSQILAESVHREVLRTLGTDDRGQKSMHLAALRALNCPAVLVESAFLSSDAEASRVASSAFRDQLAQALFAGIRDYAAEIDRLHPRAAHAPTASAVPTAPSARATPPRP